jgi:Tol biopolymer transport system component
LNVRRGWRFLGSACLAGLLLLTLPGSASAAFPGKNGRIAFGSQNEIYSVNPDGTGLTRLTQQDNLNRLGASLPRWSPDGRRIAYRQNVRFCDLSEHDSLCESVVTIRVMNADGSGQVELRRGMADVTSLTWSSDGSKIAFASPSTTFPQTSASRIWIMNADGSALTNLTLGAGPAWSPDGGRIAFSGFVNIGAGTFEIFTIRPDGTERTRVTHADPSDFVIFETPNWSPDGSRLVFSQRRGAIDLFTVNADGSTLQNITNSQCASAPHDCELFPVWSPDGSKVLFLEFVPTTLTTVNPDGTALTRLPDPGVPLSPLITDPWTRMQTLSNQIDWQPLPGPSRADFKNAAKFCAAEQEFWGLSEFRLRYGTGPNAANAHGKCVSQSH